MSRFTFTTAGESHGPELVVIVSGVPAGLRLERSRIDGDLRRRQLGYGRGTRMKIESDSADLLSGVRGGETLGSPIAISIANRDHENWRGVMSPWESDSAESDKRRIHAPRPGHADLAGGTKYDRRDLRDILERASARETAARVAAGAIAKELLRAFAIEIRSAVVALGDVGNPFHTPSWEDLGQIDDESGLRIVDSSRAAEMMRAIDAAREEGDTLGGVIVVNAHGVPPGLGSHVQWDEKLDGRIGGAILSVHAVKAVAIGDGVSAAARRGSQVHDPIAWSEAGGYHRLSNRAGGLEGGITNGEDVIVRAFMKPISTIRQGLPSVDIDDHSPHRSQWERSDVTAVPACGVVCEAMLAIVLADAMRAKFGGDSMAEMRRNFDGYIEQVRRY
jgi:chorismate synthase